MTRSPREPVGVACIQVRNHTRRPGEVTADLHDRAAQAAEAGASLIVLPELAMTGYATQAATDLAEPLEGPSVKELAAWSANLPGNPLIVTSILEERRAGRPWDTGIVVDRDGLVGSQRKLQLWGEERSSFTPGQTPQPIATRLGRLGILTCYDVSFPEIARALTLQGCWLLAVPAAYGRQRLFAWDIMTRARALENGCYVIAAGLHGADSRSNREFAGHSRIVTPYGQVDDELAEGEGIVVGVADTALVNEARGTLPYLRDISIGFASTDIHLNGGSPGDTNARC